MYLFLLLGLLFILLSVEQAMAFSNGWHVTLSSWLWAVLFLVGIFFLCKSWDEKKEKS